MQSKKLKLSVTIITLNEATNMARSIKSVSFADEVVIIDSGSTDDTVQIATNLGAKVCYRPFIGYGQQKNLAASLCKNDWILNIDADEEVTPELHASIEKVISEYETLLANENGADGKSVYDIDCNSDHNCGRPIRSDLHARYAGPYLYKLNRLTFFCGQAIKHGGWFPDWQTRLYHKDYAVWTTPHVHEELVLKENDNSNKKNLSINLSINKGISRIAKLDGSLNHFSFPDFTSQINRNIRYASLGAKEVIECRAVQPRWWEILYRPPVKFFECYIIKLGILDGLFGFIIAINAAYSIFMKYSLAYLYKDNNNY